MGMMNDIILKWLFRCPSFFFFLCYLRAVVRFVAESHARRGMHRRPSGNDLRAMIHV